MGWLFSSKRLLSYFVFVYLFPLDVVCDVDIPSELIISYDPLQEGCQAFLYSITKSLSQYDKFHVRNHPESINSEKSIVDPREVRDILLSVFAFPDNARKPQINSSLLVDEITLPVKLAGKNTEGKMNPNVKAQFRYMKNLHMDHIILPESFTSQNALQFKKQISGNKCIRFAEFPTSRSLIRPPPSTDSSSSKNSEAANVYPNDPFFNRQPYFAAMNIPDVWAQWTGPTSKSSRDSGTASIVGVTDTGCDIRHPDLIDRFWKNPKEICDNGIDDDGNGYVDDCYGYDFFSRTGRNLFETTPHGTSVSAAITANTNNNIGVAGVCWSCKVMCLKIGQSSLALAAFVEAVNYAIGYGVKTINFSAGGSYSAVERQAMIDAAKHDVIFVVAAGNSNCDLSLGTSCSQSSYPGLYNLPNVISVGSVNADDSISAFSNTGSIGVQVFAPGGNVFLPKGKLNGVQSTYGLVSGTSFSSPLVAGVVALMRSAYPNLAFDIIKSAITTTCRKKKEFKGKSVCPGIIDAMAALQKASDYLTARPKDVDPKKQKRTTTTTKKTQQTMPTMPRPIPLPFAAYLPKWLF